MCAQFCLIVFDPLCDSQEDAQPMQTIDLLWVRLGHSDQDLFSLSLRLAQDVKKRLQKHLKKHIYGRTEIC